MKNKIYRYFLFIFLGFFAQQISANAQETQTVIIKDMGITVSFQTEMRATTENRLLKGSFDTYVFLEKRNIVHRVLIDEKSGLYFGYDFEIEPASAQNMFKISVKPLSIEPRKQKINLNSYIPSPLLKGLDSMFMKEGEAAMLYLLENMQTKVRIIDLIKVTRNTSSDVELPSSGSGLNKLPPTDSTSSAGAARDFTPDAIETKLINAKLYINDKRILNSVKETYIAGAGEFLYLYVKGKGRFIFSLVPRQNYKFKKIGVAENNEISFTIDNTNYRLTSDIPILELSGRWNIWVLHEPEYTPKFEFTSSENYKIGTVDLSEGGIK